MSIEVWIYYLLAVLVLTASPGPSSLLCMTKSMTSGWLCGCYTALGSLTAITVIMTLSFTGLGIVIASSDWVFTFVKWLGSAYLIYLGVKFLTSKQETYLPIDVVQTKQIRFDNHYFSGFIVGASNPKAILFFTAFFPQFINPAANMWIQYVVFATTFVILEFSWLMLYAYLGTKTSNWIFSSGKAKLVNRLTGGVFIGAGALLSTANRV